MISIQSNPFYFGRIVAWKQQNRQSANRVKTNLRQLENFLDRFTALCSADLYEGESLFFFFTNEKASEIFTCRSVKGKMCYRLVISNVRLIVLFDRVDWRHVIRSRHCLTRRRRRRFCVCGRCFTGISWIIDVTLENLKQSFHRQIGEKWKCLLPRRDLQIILRSVQRREEWNSSLLR